MDARDKDDSKAASLILFGLAFIIACTVIQLTDVYVFKVAPDALPDKSKDAVGLVSALTFMAEVMVPFMVFPWMAGRLGYETMWDHNGARRESIYWMSGILVLPLFVQFAVAALFSE